MNCRIRFWRGSRPTNQAKPINKFQINIKMKWERQGKQKIQLHLTFTFRIPHTHNDCHNLLGTFEMWQQNNSIQRTNTSQWNIRFEHSTWPFAYRQDKTDKTNKRIFRQRAQTQSIESICWRVVAVKKRQLQSIRMVIAIAASTIEESLHLYIFPLQSVLIILNRIMFKLKMQHRSHLPVDGGISVMSRHHPLDYFKLSTAYLLLESAFILLSAGFRE